MNNFQNRMNRDFNSAIEDWLKKKANEIHREKTKTKIIEDDADVFDKQTFSDVQLRARCTTLTPTKIVKNGIDTEHCKVNYLVKHLLSNTIYLSIVGNVFVRFDIAAKFESYETAEQFAIDNGCYVELDRRTFS